MGATALSPSRFVDGHPDPRWRKLCLAAMASGGRRRARLPDLLASVRDLDGMFTFAKRNLVAPMVAHAIIESGTGGEALTRAESVHDASDARMATLLSELDRVASALTAAGVPVVALKNAGIARAVYPCAACCPMGDLDLLIAKPDFHAGHQAMLGAGYRMDSRAEIEEAEVEFALHSGGGEYVREVAGEEVWIELQWRPVAGRWIRRDQEPDAAELIERAEPVPGSDVRILSPVDNMIQVALHTAKHSYVRAPGLRLHTDVDRLANFRPPDWDAFIGMATRLQVRAAAYFSLALAVALLDSAVPTDVLGALDPGALRRRVVPAWLERVDVFEPHGEKWSRPGMMAFHALLYDDAIGLLSSALDTEPGELTLANLPTHLRAGSRRLRDLATRYQR